MADTTTTEEEKPEVSHGEHHEELPFWRKYIFSTDHKMIGIQYTITGGCFLFFGPKF